MPLKLVSKSDTYDFTLPLKDEPEENWPIFKMRKLAAGEVNRIEDKLVVSKPGTDDSFGYLTGTAAQLKIECAVAGWEKVFDANDKPAPCTPVNKAQLPASIQAALIEHIDMVNGLKKTASRVDYEKNSTGQLS